MGVTSSRPMMTMGEVVAWRKAANEGGSFSFYSAHGTRRKSHGNRKATVEIRGMVQPPQTRTKRASMPKGGPAGSSAGRYSARRSTTGASTSVRSRRSVSGRYARPSTASRAGAQAPFRLGALVHEQPSAPRPPLLAGGRQRPGDEPQDAGECMMPHSRSEQIPLPAGHSESFPGEEAFGGTGDLGGMSIADLGQGAAHGRARARRKSLTDIDGLADLHEEERQRLAEAAGERANYQQEQARQQEEAKELAAIRSRMRQEARAARKSLPSVTVTDRWARFGVARAKVPQEHEGFVRVALEGARETTRKGLVKVGVLSAEILDAYDAAKAGTGSQDGHRHRLYGGGDGHWDWEREREAGAGGTACDVGRKSGGVRWAWAGHGEGTMSESKEEHSSRRSGHADFRTSRRRRLELLARLRQEQFALEALHMEELEAEMRLRTTYGATSDGSVTSDDSSAERVARKLRELQRVHGVGTAREQAEADFDGAASLEIKHEGRDAWPRGVVLERPAAASGYMYGEWGEHVAREAGEHGASARAGDLEGYNLRSWSRAPAHGVIPALMDSDRELAVALARQERARLRRHASYLATGATRLAQ